MNSCRSHLCLQKPMNYKYSQMMDVFTVIFIAHTHRLLLVFSFDKTVSSLCRQVRHISFMCHRKKAQPQRPQSHPDTVTFTQANKCEQVGFILAPFDRLQNRIIIAKCYNSTAGDTQNELCQWELQGAVLS